MKHMCICSSNNQFHQLQEQIKHIDKFLSIYSWLADAYVLDFFTEKHWEQLPDSWRLVLDDARPDKLAAFISLNEEKYSISQSVLPLSLLSFRKTCQALAIKRNPPCFKNVIETLRNISTNLENTSLINDDIEDSFDWRRKASDEFNHGGGQHSHIDSIFRKHLKPKKQHEIYRLSKVIKEALKLTKCDRVVDVGSGQGHLSRFLSLNFGFKVVTIEAEGCHISGAKKIDSEVVKNLTKKAVKNGCAEFDPSLVPPDHKIHYLSSKSDNSDLCEILRNSWVLGTEKDNEGSNMSFSIIGLHTCGNLASTILKTFIDNTSAKSLVSVGCCYMKTDSSGFPLSKLVKTLMVSKISYEAKEVACHAIEIFQKRLKSKPELLKVHCYRATLEVIILKHYPDLKRTGLRSVKHVENLSFYEYGKKALSKQNFTISEDDLKSPQNEASLRYWKKVVVFYSLRLLLAPVIETLILFDRMVYLYEAGISSCVIPIFDPDLSPRNLVLVAMK